MRAAAGLTIVGLLVAAALVAVAPPARSARRHALLDLGDSLAVGTAPSLQARLHGHRIE
ncbi:MAG TPA: hypothetical protein VK926_08370 [Gaiellaceae bacterium]|nr:hypothetical protein [Gaiellaceae bacterium]